MATPSKTKEPKKEKELTKEPVTETVHEKAVADTVSYYEGIGRRRTATCRVRLYVVPEEKLTIRGVEVLKGNAIVNERPIASYFPGEIMKRLYMEPFRTTNTMNRFAVSATTSGGGLNGQLDSFVLGVSRALLKVDLEKFRPILKKRGFLTRDPRARERRKPNRGGKARAGKQSPKR